MAEPLARTPDVPNFDVYPAAAPNAELALLEHASGDRLNDTAEQIGATVGRAIRTVRGTVRQLPDQLNSLKARFTVIRGRSQSAAAEKASELKEQAEQQVERARLRIEVLVRDYPLEVLAGVAGVAFLAGVGLRVWRANRG